MKVYYKIGIALLLVGIVAFAMPTKNKKTPKMENAIVTFETNFGTIKIKLYNETPLHRDNFIKLAEEHYYDSLLFHRVIDNFMIQAGDPKSKGAAAGTAAGGRSKNSSGFCAVTLSLCRTAAAASGIRWSTSRDSPAISLTPRAVRCSSIQLKKVWIWGLSQEMNMKLRRRRACAAFVPNA